MSETRELPSKLSPSRIKDYLQCPRLFYYKSVLKLPTPPTEATARGTAAHYAFEHVFNHPRGERTPDVAVPYVRAAWRVMTVPFVDKGAVEEGSPEWAIRVAEQGFVGAHAEGSPEWSRKVSAASEYRALFAEGSDHEELFLRSAEEAVQAWFGMENPNKFDPVDREKYVAGQVAGALVHGFVDRLDDVQGPSESRLYISDYKTGKVPKPRYEDEAFFQLEVYALLLREMTGRVAHQLRLLYVKEGHPGAVLTRQVTERSLSKAQAKIAAAWKGIQAAHAQDRWEPRKQVLCGWCAFSDICPAMNPELEGLPVVE